MKTVIDKKYYVTKRQVSDFINSLKSPTKSASDFKDEIRTLISELDVIHDKAQIKFYSAVIKELSKRDDINIPRNTIRLVAWLKNNTEWYYPMTKNLLDIDVWSNYEVIHYFNDENFLVYCWNGEKVKNDGRLYKGCLK